MLEKPPQIEIIEFEKAPSSYQYLKVEGRWVKFKYADGSLSEPFWSQHVYREGGINASVMIAHYLADGVRYIYLRSCIRPAVEAYNKEDGNLWEVAAGKIDNESPQQAAIRETEEELGFKVKPEDMIPLGEFVYASVGLMGERLHFFECEVDPNDRFVPTEDGSPMERKAKIIAIPLRDAYEILDFGLLKDSKTEIAIHRIIKKYKLK